MFRQISPLLSSRHGVDIGDVYLLTHVKDSDMTPSEIAEEMQIPAHGVSRKLDTLSKNGLVSRTLHPEDARKRVLTLTKKGEKTLATAQQTLEQETDKMLQQLDSDALTIFLDNLEILSKPKAAST